MPEKPDREGQSPAPRPMPTTDLSPPPVFHEPKTAPPEDAIQTEPLWTAEHIRHEHETTMASFTPVQSRALARISRAFRESHLGNMSAREAMVRVYEEEAGERNRGSQSEMPIIPEPPPGQASGFSDTEG